MENKKNRFFVFLFSLMPGAGEMYLGALGKGAVLMVAFFLWLIISFEIGNGAILLFTPVIWFYSFMDTHSSKKLTKEEIKASNDKFIKNVFNLFTDNSHKGSLITKKLGILIIAVGIIFFITSVIRSIDYFASKIILCIFISFIIIFIGILLAKRQVYKEICSEKDIFNDNELNENSDALSDTSSCTHHIDELISQTLFEDEAEKNICPSCHENFSEGDKFCSNCGLRLTPEEKICSSCGNKLDSHMKFCPECGQKTEF